LSARLIHCSFCHASEAEVPHIFASAAAAICSVCVDLCHEYLHRSFDELGEHFAAEMAAPPAPA